MVAWTLWLSPILPVYGKARTPRGAANAASRWCRRALGSDGKNTAILNYRVPFGAVLAVHDTRGHEIAVADFDGRRWRWR